MADPYAILGVGRNASAREVRDAYRRLALKFHPDRNPDPSANQRFQEINAAYAAIRAPRISRPPVAPPPRPYYRPRRSTSSNAQEQKIFASAAPYIRIWFVVFAIGCGTLIVDYLLPVRIEVERAVRVVGYPVPLVEMENGEKVTISKSQVTLLRKDSRVEVHTSLFFGFLRELRPLAGGAIRNLGSVYSNFAFAPLSWLLLAFAGIVVKKSQSARFYIAVVQLLLTLIFFPLFVASGW